MRVRDLQDQDSWREFVDLYAPMIRSYLGRIGVVAKDRDGLTQEVFCLIVRRIPTFVYDPHKGRFRGWLRKVTLNLARRYFTRAARQVAAGGGTERQKLLELLPDPDAGLDDVWERQWRQRCLEVAMQKVQSRVKRHTWEAFRMSTLEGKPGKDIADQLGMTIGHVYVSKSHVLKMLREEVETINE